MAVLGVIAAASVYLIVIAVQTIRRRRVGCCDKPTCLETTEPSQKSPPRSTTHFIPVDNLAKAAGRKSS